MQLVAVLSFLTPLRMKSSTADLVFLFVGGAVVEHPSAKVP